MIRESMEPKTDTSSEDYKRFRVVTDEAIRSLQLLGAELVDPFTIPELKSVRARLTKRTCSKLRKPPTST
jgi:hypothetical protein